MGVERGERVRAGRPADGAVEQPQRLPRAPGVEQSVGVPDRADLAARRRPSFGLGESLERCRQRPATVQDTGRQRQWAGAGLLIGGHRQRLAGEIGGEVVLTPVVGDPSQQLGTCGAGPGSHGGLGIGRRPRVVAPCHPEPGSLELRRRRRGERERFAEQLVRSVVVVAGGRQARCVGQRPRGELAVPAAPGVERHAQRIGVRPSDQGPGGFEVQVLAAGRGDRRLDRRTDQCVSEPVAVLGVVEQPGARAGVEIVQYRWNLLLQDGRQRVDVHVRSEYRRCPDRAGRARERRQLALDGVTDRRRDRLVGPGRHDRLEQQRVPSAPSVQLGGALGAGDLGDRVGIEWAEQHRPLPRHARATWASGDHEREPIGASGHPVQPGRRGGIGVMDVLDRQDRHPVTGERAESPQHGREQVHLLECRRHDRHLTRRCADTHDRGEDPGVEIRQCVERVWGCHPRRRRQRVGDGPQRQVAPESVAAPLGDQHSTGIE